MLRPCPYEFPWLAALLTLSFCAYGGLLSTGFASEDFLILGHLHDLSLWQVLTAELTGPWLGLEHVNFYRPVATFFLALEAVLWGLEPAAFHAFHALLHGLNGWFVMLITALLTPKGPRWLGPAVACLFVLQPLHPGAVLFIGGFATLWGSAFQLVSVWLGLRFVVFGEKSAAAGCLAALALALGSYEAAAVLPAVLATGALAMLPPASGGRVVFRRRWLTIILGSALLLGLYLALRKLLLGVVLGGYPSFQERLTRRVASMAEAFLSSLPKLAYPDLSLKLDRPGAVFLGAGIVVVVAVLAAWRPALRRPMVLGVVWAGLFQLPFSFPAVVPATGRFWYLASFAMMLTLASAVAAVFFPTERGKPSQALDPLLSGSRPGIVGGALALVMLSTYAASLGLLLRGHLQAYGEADRIMERVEHQMLLWEKDHGPAAVAVAGVPAFVHDEQGAPVAKVFQYGLHEAMGPPFGGARAFVLPVPDYVAPDRLLPLSAALEGTALRWRPEEERLVPVTGAPVDPDLLETELRGGEVLFSCLGCTSVRLFVATAGATFRGEPVDGRQGAIPLPEAFLRGMAGLYDGPALWWLEERKQGVLQAASETHRLDLDDLSASPQPLEAARTGRVPESNSRVISTTARRESASASPLPAISKAVPWSTEVRR